MGSEELVAAVVERDVVVATGPDAAVYLQGQLSQDIEAIGTDGTAWSLLLEPQGKLVARLRVTASGGDTFLLDLEPGFGEAVVARLERFKLRTALQLSLERWRMIAYRGDGAHEIDPGGAPIAHAHAWASSPALDVVGPEVEPVAGRRIDVAGIDALRIEAGVPAMGRELTEATIPAEAAIVGDAVSFTKGCYTGQELVARIDSRGGNTPRRLRRLEADRPLAVGTELRFAGKVVGSITSSATGRHGTGVGLALIGRAVEPPAEVEADDGPIQVLELPG